MAIKASKLASDLTACVGKGNSYGKPEIINLAKLKAGGQKVRCAGFVKAALPSLYNGTNTIWRKAYLTQKGSISDHTAGNGFSKSVGKPLKKSQLKIGMAVFKWSKTGCSKAEHEADGQGNYHHIGIVCSVNPLKIVHSSSVNNRGPVITGIEDFCAWGYLKGVDYGTESTTSQPIQTGGDINMLYQAKVATASAPLNVRANPSTKAAKVGNVNKGAVVSVYETKSGWSRITYGSLQGWCSSKYLKKTSGTQQAASEAGAADMTIEEYEASIRRGEGVSYEDPADDDIPQDTGEPESLPERVTQLELVQAVILERLAALESDHDVGE